MFVVLRGILLYYAACGWRTTGFRWDLEEDKELCVEVCKVRPEKSIQWLDVSESLNKQFTSTSRDVQHMGKGCKERLFLLIKKYKEEDGRGLKRCVGGVYMHACIFLR